MEDIEIARNTELEKIDKIAENIGIKEDEIEIYGRYKAKIDNKALLERLKDKKNGKLILDACCGSRMFWFDKYNPLALFVDKRSETLTAKDRDKIRIIEIRPDIVADFTNLPFEDSSFYMVVFDPPHLKTLGKTSWMAKKYGRLPDNWQEMIKSGFDECMRVLKPNGTLVFKWSESEIKVNEVLSIIPYKPLFGHTTGRQSKTIWMCFMKLPIN